MYSAKPLDGAVWITGASTGIGAATAEALEKQGYTVYISARSKDKLNALASKATGAGKLVALPLDVTDRNACKNAVETIVKAESALALVILNAGIFMPVRGFDLNYESFDKTMAINFGGVVNGLLPAIEAMKEAGRGQLAIVSSVAGLGGLKQSASYGASKAALINMAESLKFDLDPMNIRIQIIMPGFVETPATDQNDFPMPFLMSVRDAADRIVQGLPADKFEITFPRRFTWMLKFVNILPYGIYFPLVNWITKGRKG